MLSRIKIGTLLRKVTKPRVPTMYQYLVHNLKIIDIRIEKYDIESREKTDNRNWPHNGPDVEIIPNVEKNIFFKWTAPKWPIEQNEAD